MKTEVEIPEGKYCGECPFLQYREVRMTNMFGDYTGNVREEIRCARTGEALKEEEMPDCPCHAKAAVKGMFCPAGPGGFKNGNCEWAFPVLAGALFSMFPDAAKESFCEAIKKSMDAGKENEGKEKH